MMALLRLKDGSVPPFGAEVFNANGVSVAMVMENGMARIAGVNPAERLSVARLAVRSATYRCHNKSTRKVTCCCLVNNFNNLNEFCHE